MRKTAAESLPRARPHRGIVPVDGAPLRERARRAYLQAMRKTRDLRVEHARYHEKDVPAFRRWLHANFGALLSDLREKQVRFDLRRSQLSEIHMLVLLEGMPMHKACVAVLDEAGREHPDGDAPGGARDGDPSRPDDGEPEGEPGPDEAPPAPWDEPAHDRKGDQPQRLKSAYREAVRRLHPDAARATAKTMERWHAVQEAYRNGDAEGIELIVAMCQVDDCEDGNIAVSVLMQLAKIHRRAATRLRRELQGLRTDISWNFAARTDRTHLAAQMRHQIAFDLRALTQALQELEAELEKARVPRQRGGGRRRSTSSPDSQMGFQW